jgi:diaminopimelate decarboxylase
VTRSASASERSSGSREEVTRSASASERSSSVLPRTAEVEDGRLLAVGGVAVGDLVAQHGTPLYVLDRAELVGRMRAYREAFGPDVAVTYAAKALCVTAVLQLAAAEGLHLDVASAGELATAARAGFPMERVILHGNNKSVDELALAADLGVSRVVADSMIELDRLEALAARRGDPIAILLRITPGVGAGGHAYIRTGQDDSKFGFTLSSGLAGEAIDRALRSAHLDLRGLHCHVGSQVTVGEAYDAATAVMVDLHADVAARRGEPLPELNLGGGLGIAYTAGDPEPSVTGYAAALRAAVTRACAAHGLPVPRLAVEPGRSIVGPAGVTLYTVGTVKEVAGIRTYVAVDGGMSDNLRPALYGARYAFLPAGEPVAPGDGGPMTCTVVGKHCETGDVLGDTVQLPGAVRPGELLAVAATGAYGHAMASNYNRLARPAMVLVGDGRADVVVRRETLDDVLARDVPLPG